MTNDVHASTKVSAGGVEGKATTWTVMIQKGALRSRRESDQI